MAQREEREKHKNYLAEEYKQQITNANKKSHIHVLIINLDNIVERKRKRKGFI